MQNFYNYGVDPKSNHIVPMDGLKSGLQREGQNMNIESPDYTEEEQQYLGALRKRLMRARDARDYHHDAFDGMTYIERCRQNRLLAAAFIPPRNNRQEVNFTTGITRQKMLAQLAQLINLNLGVDITAYNDKSVAISDLGDAMEDIIDKSKELDNDEEKMMRRQYTMMEQGEVFVEVQWKKGYYMRKIMQNFTEGKFKEVQIDRLLKRTLDKLMTNIIRNEKVYLGDVSNFDMDTQPFVFTIDIQPYELIEPLFKDFEMWKWVTYSLNYFDATTEYAEGFIPFWTLSDWKKGYVEIVRYQAKSENEMQILINGIPMLPIGYALSELSPDCEYMLVKQVFSLIDEHFAYGKSLLQLLKSAAGLEDEFWRLAFLKGQQSFLPPMINNTGRILSSKVMMPGTFTNNIPDGKLKPIIDSNGITNGEIAVLKMLRDNIDEQSTAPQISGQQPEGDPTATEVNKVQSQAEKMLGLTVMSAALLEKKIAELTIPILLKNWFDPVDNVIDNLRQGVVDVYRAINVEKPVDGQGIGQEIVEVTPGSMMPRPYEVFEEEKRLKKQTGVPTRKIYLNRDHMIATKYMWRVSIIPQPKKTSNLQKLMFRDKSAVYMQSPNFSMDWFEENAALTWGDNPQKVFKRQQPTQATGVMPTGKPVKPTLPTGKMATNEAGNV